MISKVNKNEFLSDAYNLGQTTDKAFAQQRKNIEAAIQDGLISLSNYENEFISNYLRANEGSTRDDALIALQSDEIYTSMKQSLNDWKEDTKNLFKEELDDAIDEFDRTLTKHEFTKPQKWDNKGQITSYYTEMLGTLNSKGNFVNGWYDAEIARLKNKLKEAKNFMLEVLPYVDIVFLGILDFINILEYKPQEEKNYEARLSDFYSELFEQYPNIKYAASTKRIVNSVNNNSLQGFLFNHDILYSSRVHTFDILDRVGGGDSFTAGILHGILNNMENSQTIEFATCASALKHSIRGDINMVDLRQVETLMNCGIENINR